MALDMSEALSEPQFQDTFTVTRSTAVIGNDGMITISSAAPVSITAVVTPVTSALTMIRLPDGSRQATTIYIYTQTMLSPGLKSNDFVSRPADVITWHGNQYTVVEIDDWSAFGPGFWRITAELLPLNPTQ